MTAWQLSRAAGVGREIVHRLVGPVIGEFVGGPRIEGQEWLVDLPRPLLICPNHQSHFDIPVLRRALGRHGRHRLAIAAADDYWFQRPAYRIVVSWFAAVPFRRIGRGAETVRAVEALLDDGWRVVIFPEGTRSRTGAIGTFKAGAGLIATHHRGAGPPRPDRRPVGGPAARQPQPTTGADAGPLRPAARPSRR